VNERARSFDRAAEEYEQGRPGYPVGVLDLIDVPPTAAVLDLAAGTGKLTRLLAERYARVVAVEPLSAMRAVLERAVPGADVRAGSAEAIPAADDEFDAVFVAQAFHWFATDVAVAEVARVLRPGGFLVLTWNTSAAAPVTPEPPAEFQQRVRELRVGSEPVGRGSLDWRAPLARGPFEELREGVVAHVAVFDADAMVARVASSSWVASRPDDERRRLLAELRALLPEASYTTALETEVYWTRLR
jgi:SAM-dependent methyltransferase